MASNISADNNTSSTDGFMERSSMDSLELTTVVWKGFSTVVQLSEQNLPDAVNYSVHDADTTISINYEQLLIKENTYEAKALIPVTIYLIILMIMGVIGNTLVLYIYKFRFKRSTSRIFILSLATFDLITCLLGMPYHIIDMLYPVMFVWDTVCKVLSFALTFTIVASIFVLDLIAIDRYRKICRPFKKQLSGFGSKALSWVVILVAIVVAVPMLFIYGSADVPTRIANVTGKECYISDEYVDSYFPMIYDGLTILIFIVSVFILVGFYSKVGVTIWKRRKFNESSNDSKRSASSQSTPSTSVIQLNIINDDTKISTGMHAHFSKDNEDGEVRVFHSNSPVSTPTDSPSPYRATTTKMKKDRTSLPRRLRIMSEPSSTEHVESSTSDQFRDSARSHFSRRHHVTKKQKRTIRITGMLFLITLVFIISFLPYLTIAILNGLDDEFWKGMNISEIVFVNFLLRTYFINNMINPIIYWFLDHKFKEEVLHLYRDIKNCHVTTRFGSVPLSHKISHS